MVPERDTEREEMFGLIRQVRDMVAAVNTSVEVLSTKVDGLPERVRDLERESAEHRGAIKLLRWAFPSGGAVIVAVCALALRHS